MEYRKLGSSGTSVSALALGTMTFGAEADEAESHRILDAYASAGGNLIDTADVYTAGTSEEIIGRWLARNPAGRDSMVIASKGRFPMGKGVNDLGLTRRHLRRALEASLTRLGVDHLDLYQVHSWDPHTPLEETLGFLDEAVRSGKISYYGFSNYTGWQLTKAVMLARASGYSAPVTLQPQYSLLVREIEAEIVPATLDAGMGLLPWSPLGGGWLSGKYSRDTLPTGATRLGENPQRGMEAWEQRNAQERTWRIIDAVGETAKGRGISASQVALAWVARQPAVTSVILGARTVDQLKDNLASAGLELTPEEAGRLDAVSAPQFSDYPYGGPALEQRSRALDGGR
ncbi:aldo/keto reductase [Arthrobacter sp. MSA 4-2]|uniref:aldo/keto reductase n=1 Tax=Arthrobacter sp. MSA 4-2 TaxID=2794349 RepID=UPI0018E738B4|nr:aldo/keto reductase [Arthrobacter sp. MSA 4-2]MBJ2121377.1 aldo/keto reductase [Arthrobacter sp. MSA 4-2]